MDMWVVANFVLLWIMLLWTWHTNAKQTFNSLLWLKENSNRSCQQQLPQQNWTEYKTLTSRIFFSAAPHGMQDLGSLTRQRIPAVQVQSLNHWTTEEVPTLWFQCVCPLMPLPTPTILLGFLLPWTCVISSWLLQQSTAAAPYLGWGLSPSMCP